MRGLATLAGVAALAVGLLGNAKVVFADLCVDVGGTGISQTASAVTGTAFADRIDCSAVGHGHTIEGLGENDFIIGSLFDDTIYGGDGDDVVVALAGADVMFGDDILPGNDAPRAARPGADIGHGGEGQDAVDDGFAGFDVDNGLLDVDRDSNFGETDGTDDATGIIGIVDGVISSFNVINGKVDCNKSGTITTDGDDDCTVNGLDVDDGVVDVDGDGSFGETDGTDDLTQDGDDHYGGGPGNDVLYGGDDHDHLGGSPGNDTLYGGPGADVLGGGPDDDTLFGGKGNDIISGGDHADTVDAGDDIDLCILDLADTDPDGMIILSTVDTASCEREVERSDAAPVDPTGIITGRVTEFDTGANLKGVTVVVVSVDSLTTKGSGKYVFDNVPAGSQTVEASKTSCTPIPASQTVTVVAGGSVTADLQLDC